MPEMTTQDTLRRLHNSRRGHWSLGDGLPMFLIIGTEDELAALLDAAEKLDAADQNATQADGKQEGAV